MPGAHRSTDLTLPSGGKHTRRCSDCQRRIQPDTAFFQCTSCWNRQLRKRNAGRSSAKRARRLIRREIAR
jgi:hypothetical protein